MTFLAIQQHCCPHPYLDRRPFDVRCPPLWTIRAPGEEVKLADGGYPPVSRERQMQGRDADVVTSGLSRGVTRDRITVELQVCSLETETEWTLEAVNAAGTSTVWGPVFLPQGPPTKSFTAPWLARASWRFFTAGRLFRSAANPAHLDDAELVPYAARLLRFLKDDVLSISEKPRAQAVRWPVIRVQAWEGGS
jgi:hypothetical protein